MFFRIWAGVLKILYTCFCLAAAPILFQDEKKSERNYDEVMGRDLEDDQGKVTNLLTPNIYKICLKSIFM